MSGSADPASLDGTAWVLSELPGRALVPKTNVTLGFEARRISGSDGCNRFSGGYTATGSALEISPQLAMTMMACPADVSEQAQAFVAALKAARSWRVGAERLELLAADGTVAATLAAQSQTLAGSRWQVVNLNNGRQAVVGVVTGSTLTLDFGADGTASGSAGCNRYNTRFESEGKRLTFTPPVSTRMMCVTPEGVMEQEQQFLKALTMVATVQRDGDQLHLRTAEDALALVLLRAESE
jgi:heat shock protein HslJ